MIRSVRRNVLMFVSIGVFFASAAYCQNEQKPTSPETNKATASESADTYRVDLTVRETQDGKSISSRNYSALVRDGHYLPPHTVRIGSRLPAGNSGTQGVNYLDIGTNLNLRLWKMEGQTILSVSVEMSSVAPGTDSAMKAGEYPVMRQFRTDQQAAIPLGKPTLLDSLDDPNGNHKFQIEVTVTKEKS